MKIIPLITFFSVAFCIPSSWAGSKNMPIIVESLPPNWSDPTTFICILQNKNLTQTVIKLNTSGENFRIKIRLIGLNGWPSIATKEIAGNTASIPHEEGKKEYLSSFTSVIDGFLYRIDFSQNLRLLRGKDVPSDHPKNAEIADQTAQIKIYPLDNKGYPLLENAMPAHTGSGPCESVNID